VSRPTGAVIDVTDRGFVMHDIILADLQELGVAEPHAA